MANMFSTVIYTYCCVCKCFIRTQDGRGKHGESHTYCDVCAVTTLLDEGFTYADIKDMGIIMEVK